MRKILIVVVCICLCRSVAVAHFADTTFKEQPITLQTGNGELMGTLTLSGSPNGPVALIIAGSGPTDRNGNSMFTKNNSYQMLAHELANLGIATVRYDKRGIAASAKGMKSEADLRFEDYINDAAAWIGLLKKEHQFSSVTIIGHSEGSLIGMVAAAKAGANKFISVAGTGRAIDEILKEQLKSAPDSMYELAVPVIDSLKQGLAVKSVDKRLVMIFRPSVQPYMISWMKYDPKQEVKKMKIPVMIVQGTNDIQVPVEDAKALYAALPTAKLELFDNMNHVLKTVEGDRKANVATYNDPSLPLAKGLVEKIAAFINKK